MKLLNQIINESIDDKVRIVTLLRKCLLLSEELSNEELRNWAGFELNGYPNRDSIPDYRHARITAKGLFIGIGNSQLADQPLPAGVLAENLRHWAQTAELFEPISAYERLALSADDGGILVINWPPDLTVKYQNKFIQGFALNRAWQEIPMGSIASLVDTVRTKILQFGLELKRGIEPDEMNLDSPSIPISTIQNAFQNIILGGNNVFSSGNLGQTSINVSSTVVEGDMNSLTAALESLGVAPNSIAELKSAIDLDSEHGEKSGVGSRVAAWLKKGAAFVGKEGGKAVTASVGKAVTGAVLAHYGIAV